jgi:hypothetical protein
MWIAVLVKHDKNKIYEYLCHVAPLTRWS